MRRWQGFRGSDQGRTDVVLDNTPESLDRLKILIDRLRLGAAKHRSTCWVGAVTARRCAGRRREKWHLKPVPFGKWAVSRQPVGNNIAMIVFPFSESVEWARFTGRMLSSFDLKESLRGQECLLVYPPSDVNSVLEVNYKDFMQARKLLDDGNIGAALDAYRRELKKRPKNAARARIVELSGPSSGTTRRRAFTKEAVEAGSRRPICSCNTRMSWRRPTWRRQLPYYRKAAQNPRDVATLIKLGKAYQKTGTWRWRVDAGGEHLTAIDGERS